MIPFTSAEFLRVFEQYNNAIWPGHVLIYVIGLGTICLAFTRRIVAHKLISLILALLWLWVGVVYHLLFFSTINKAARLFGALFIIQSAIFIFAGVLSSRLAFRFRFDVQGLIGAALMTYSLVGYPMVGIALGHTYPAAPTFGVPCPTAIFTFGLLLAAGINVRFYMLIIPVLWSLMALWAAISLGMYEDIGLVVAALSTVLLIRSDDPMIERLSSLSDLPRKNIKRPTGIVTNPVELQMNDPCIRKHMRSPTRNSL